MNEECSDEYAVQNICTDIMINTISSDRDQKLQAFPAIV